MNIVFLFWKFSLKAWTLSFFAEYIINIDEYLYLYKYENVCLFVCLFTFFSAIWNPIGIPFDTNLLFVPEKVLKQ